MRPALEVRLLGSFGIRYGQKTVSVTSRPAQSLFAYLVLNAGTAYRREKLAGMMWPESPEESARDYLRHALWRIRKALQSASAASYLQADDLTIAFDGASEYWLDVAVLREVEESGSPEALMQALSGYRGELLPGFYDEWVVLEREHLQSVYERKIGFLLETLQASERWSDMLEWGEKWIACGQRPEAAYRYLMSAYAALGDMARAVAAYERCVKSLSEFGVEPSEQTRRLYEDLKRDRGKSVLAPQAESSIRPARQPASNLPVPLTSFVGREKALKEIAKLLREYRLVTLLGPGGVGKTRLAIEAADQVAGSFRDGVWWIDLVGLSDPALVPQAILHATGVHEVQGQTYIEALNEHFSHRQTLLILDNCEHLISAAAQAAASLLAGSKELRILTTSREALDVLGETTWRVPSLSLPEAGERLPAKMSARSESVHLFLERVTSAQPGFKLTNQNAEAVARICERLGGIPLAIELAAARVRMMSVEEIAQRLDDSFDLLSAGNRSALPRHQTLRATIDWSYQLLSDAERILFRRLSVFAGGFTLEAAEEVASGRDMLSSQAVGVLGQLINKSLVMAQVQFGESRGETRYTMLETIRQYAAGKLEEAGETHELRQRHLRFFANFALRGEAGIYSPQQVEWFGRIEQDADNLRAALDCPGLLIDAPGGAQRFDYSCHYLIVSSLAMFWERGYRREITQVHSKLLEADTASEPTIQRAKALYAGGFLQWSLYNFSLAERYLEEAIELSKRLRDPLTLAWALGYLGWTLDSLGEYDKAKGYLERSMETAKSLGQAGAHAAASSLSFLGDIPYRRGDLEEARRLYEESISFTRSLGNSNTLTYPLRRLGYVCVHQGDYEQAAELFSECLRLNRQLDHRPGIAACVAGYAAIEVAGGRLETAAILFGQVEMLLERFGAPFFELDKVEYERAVLTLREQLGRNKISRAWARGRAMTLDEAIALVMGARK